MAEYRAANVDPWWPTIRPYVIESIEQGESMDLALEEVYHLLKSERAHLYVDPEDSANFIVVEPAHSAATVILGHGDLRTHRRVRLEECKRIAKTFGCPTVRFAGSRPGYLRLGLSKEFEELGIKVRQVVFEVPA